MTLVGRRTYATRKKGKMKTIEALWAVHFGDVAVPGQVNGGVVVFETLRIFGGDSKFYYIGEYDVSGDKVTGTVVSTHFSGDGMTAFGFSTEGSIRVRFSGLRIGDKIDGDAWLVDQPLRKVKITLERLADLP